MSAAREEVAGTTVEALPAIRARRGLMDGERRWTPAEIAIVQAFATSHSGLPLGAPAAVGLFYADRGPVACRAAVDLVADAIFGCLTLEGVAPEVAECLAAAFADQAWLAAQMVWVDGLGADGDAPARH